MKVSNLIEILKGFHPDYSVDIGMISQYPDTLNAERVLEDRARKVVVIEADD